MSYRILLVEDDRQIREVIEDYFSVKSSGEITLVTAADGEEGMELIQYDEFDLVMLDIMLPHVDGFTICREIRRKSIVPVLFLTAKATEADLLHGYELGCDDYMIKPFSPAELYAKVNALLKRAKGMVISKEIVCGRISINLVTFEAAVDGKTVELFAKGGTAGRLFGSITSKEVTEAVNAKFGTKIDKKKVTLDSDIKTFGTYNAEIKLHNGVVAKCSVSVKEK